MDLSLDKLDKFVAKKNQPTSMEAIYYLFWDKGISLTEFNQLPIPYILSILKVHTYKNKEEQKEIKRANRKK